MNRKLIKASLAGTAALALAAGGTTFAAWSDFYVLDGSNVGADVLALNVNDSIRGASFNDLKMYPGGGGEYEFVVASRVGDAVPDASLGLVFENVDDSGDTPSSNSEDLAEDNLLDSIVTPAGEFDDEATMIVNSSAVIPDIANVTDPCDSKVYARGGRQSVISVADFVAQTDLGAAGSALNVLPAGETLKAGEGVCVALAINLPAGASNAVQGDDVSFDIRFLLDQIMPTP